LARKILNRETEGGCGILQDSSLATRCDHIKSLFFSLTEAALNLHVRQFYIK